jgi:hypothetical protein
VTAIVIGCLAATVVRSEDTSTQIDGKVVVTVKNGVILLSLGGQERPFTHAAFENDDVAELMRILVEALNANGAAAMLRVHEVAEGEPS